MLFNTVLLSCYKALSLSLVQFLSDRQKKSSASSSPGEYFSCLAVLINGCERQMLHLRRLSQIETSQTQRRELISQEKTDVRSAVSHT